MPWTRPARPPRGGGRARPATEPAGNGQDGKGQAGRGQAAAFEQMLDLITRRIARAVIARNEGASFVDDRSTDQAGSRAFADHTRGILSLVAGDPAGAVPYLAAAAEGHRAAGRGSLAFRATSSRLAALGMLGRSDEVDSVYLETVTWADHDEADHFGGYLLEGPIQARLQRGEVDAARELIVQRITIQAANGDRPGYTRALVWLAQCEATLGDHERATVLVAAHERLAQEMGSVVSAASASARDEAADAAARLALGERRHRAARERGRRFNDFEAIAYAIGTPDQSDDRRTTVSPLTPRELEVTALVADGLTNATIAEALYITPRTVRGHLENILAKLGFDNRCRVAAWYVEHYGGFGPGPSDPG